MSVLLVNCEKNMSVSDNQHIFLLLVSQNHVGWSVMIEYIISKPATQDWHVLKLQKTYLETLWLFLMNSSV